MVVIWTYLGGALFESRAFLPSVVIDVSWPYLDFPNEYQNKKWFLPYLWLSTVHDHLPISFEAEQRMQLKKFS